MTNRIFLAGGISLLLQANGVDHLLLAGSTMSAAQQSSLVNRPTERRPNGILGRSHISHMRGRDDQTRVARRGGGLTGFLRRPHVSHPPVPVTHRPHTGGDTGGGAVIPALISDAKGLWYFDLYQTTNNNAIVPNQTAAAQIVDVFSEQLTRQSRRITTMWNYSNSGNPFTITTSIAGPNGLDDASRLSIVSANGAWKLYQLLVQPSTFATGTYTIACNVRAQSGNGKFKFLIPFQDSYSSEMTATGSWQRFSKQITANIPYFAIGHDSPAADTVLDISDFNVYAGSSDLGTETFAGHLRINIHNNGTMAGITFADGAMSFVEVPGGFIQWPSGITASNMTVLCYCKVLSPQHDNFQVWLSNPADDRFVIGTNVTSSGFGISYGEGSGSQRLIDPGTYPYVLDTTAYHVIAATWDGSTGIAYIDGVEVFRTVTSTLFAPINWDFMFNDLISHAASFAYKSLVYVERAGSAAEVLAATNYLIAR